MKNQVNKKCSLCGAEMFCGHRTLYCSPLCAVIDNIVMGGIDECWEWLGGKYKTGYGKFKYKGKTLKPYRIMCELRYGPFGNLCAMHSCDNRGCCNPFHLSVGTHAENIFDMDRKKRRVTARGEDHGHAKFTNQQIAEIRKKRKAGAMGTVLAREYNCSPIYIYSVCNGWRRSKG